MITIFKQTTIDKRILTQLNIDPKSLINNEHDYSKEIVKKPWGYEYQLFSNQELAVWILHINGGEETSFHCHPNKDTALTVLETQHFVICGSLHISKPLQKGDTLLINKGTFHKTTALFYPAIVMEIETPINKNDLVRYKDNYGRV